MNKSEIRNPKSEIDLIVFDAGGVMLRICHGGWRQVCGRLGIEPPATIGDEASPRLHEIGAAYETGRIDEPAFIAQAAAATGFSEATVAAALDAWLIEPFAGIGPFINRVVETGIPTAVLSNTNRAHWRLMCTDSHARIPVDRLRYRFTSFEIGAMKPDAAVYEHVERETGAAPERILFFDDHPPNIAAAAARRWHAVRIDHHGDTVAQMSHHLTSLGLWPA